jgi:hypothetical protein
MRTKSILYIHTLKAPVTQRQTLLKKKVSLRLVLNHHYSSDPKALILASHVDLDLYISPPICSVGMLLCMLTLD